MQDTQIHKDWYLVQIKPNSSRIARRNLMQQGFALFNPVHEESRIVRNKSRIELRPLFPGYMFVSIVQSSAPWRAINSTYGVSNIVTLGQSRPQPVPAKFMNALMSRCDDDGQLLSSDALLAGDKVRVLTGPFSDFVTNVEHVSRDKRVWVLLDILGGATKVALEPESLIKI